MDAATIAALVVAPLVVAGVGGLVKLAFNGVQHHLAQQDIAITQLRTSLHSLEVNLAELSGTLRGRPRRSDKKG